MNSSYKHYYVTPRLYMKNISDMVCIRSARFNHYYLIDIECEGLHRWNGIFSCGCLDLNDNGQLLIVGVDDI